MSERPSRGEDRSRSSGITHCLRRSLQPSSAMLSLEMRTIKGESTSSGVSIFESSLWRCLTSGASGSALPGKYCKNPWSSRSYARWSTSISTTTAGEEVRDSERPAAARADSARSIVDDLEDVGDLSIRVGESLRLPGCESASWGALPLGLPFVELRLGVEPGCPSQMDLSEAEMGIAISE